MLVRFHKFQLLDTLTARAYMLLHMKVLNKEHNAVETFRETNKEREREREKERERERKSREGERKRELNEERGEGRRKRGKYSSTNLLLPKRYFP